MTYKDILKYWDTKKPAIDALFVDYPTFIIHEEKLYNKAEENKLKNYLPDELFEI